MPGLGQGSSIPVYADATLGFAEAWGDLRKVPGYALFVTTDAGKTWSPAPAPIAGRYRASDHIQVTQVDEQGNTVWLLLTLASDSPPHSDLFVSGDHGVTWRLVPAAGSR
jgi:hypothetical protein